MKIPHKKNRTQNGNISEIEIKKYFISTLMAFSLHSLIVAFGEAGKRNLLLEKVCRKKNHIEM